MVTNFIIVFIFGFACGFGLFLIVLRLSPEFKKEKSPEELQRQLEAQKRKDAARIKADIAKRNKRN